MLCVAVQIWDRARLGAGARLGNWTVRGSCGFPRRDDARPAGAAARHRARVGQRGVRAYCSELGQRQGPAQGISPLPSASTGYGKYTRNFSAQKGSGPCDATSSGVQPVHLTWAPSAS